MKTALYPHSTALLVRLRGLRYSLRVGAERLYSANQYTARVELYDTNGNVDCTIAKTDEPDGTDPSLSSDPCGS